MYIKVKIGSEFDKQIIKFINRGTWKLFIGKHVYNKAIKYVLYTGKTYYYLDKNGKAISDSRTLRNFIKENIAFFKE